MLGWGERANVQFLSITMSITMLTDLEVDNYFKSKECDASTSFVKFKVKKTTLSWNHL